MAGSTTTTVTSAPAAPAKAIVPILIQQDDPQSQFATALCYGASRSGKTRFAGSWPRPLFLSEASEQGWKTLQSMPRDCFYEPDRPPIVWPIEDAAQMAVALEKIPQMIADFSVMTLVIDSLTFYQDAFFLFLKKSWAKLNPGKAIDTRALYGTLADHLHELRQRIHTWRCNVVWLALEKAPDTDNPKGGPLLTGKARERFPAGCDHVFYHETFTFPNEVDPNIQDVFYAMHTTSYMKWLAGGRDSGLLEPCMYNPTYREFARQLGLIDPLTMISNAATKRGPAVAAR